MKLAKGCLVILVIIAAMWYGIYRVGEWLLFEIQKAEVLSLAESFKNGD